MNWLEFLTTHNIEHATTGANVARGNVTIRCPLCERAGDPDPGMHLGISLNNAGWNCWRNREHRGKNPARLVAALLGCSYAEAMQITGTSRTIPDDIEARVKALFAKPEEPKHVLHRPKEFKVLNNLTVCKGFVGYLRERNFSYDDIWRMEEYDIFYCTQGAYAYRIMFMIYHQFHLVSWSGRTIIPNREPRYKVLSADPEKAKEEGYKPALGSNTDYLLWYDDIKLLGERKRCHTLVLCEGPFDALRINLLGETQHGITATCFFRADPTPNQVDSIFELSALFERTVLLLDAGTMATAMQTQNLLQGITLDIQTLPKGIKDPAELRDLHFLLDGVLARGKVGTLHSRAGS